MAIDSVNSRWRLVARRRRDGACEVGPAKLSALGTSSAPKTRRCTTFFRAGRRVPTQVAFSPPGWKSLDADRARRLYPQRRACLQWPTEGWRCSTAKYRRRGAGRLPGWTNYPGSLTQRATGNDIVTCTGRDPSATRAAGRCGGDPLRRAAPACRRCSSHRLPVEGAAARRAVLTDRLTPGGTSGLIGTHASPEAAAGGAIAGARWRRHPASTSRRGRSSCWSRGVNRRAWQDAIG